ncbi:MAG: tetratricopeptide repeat protein, partial [Rikenellaceae bacterium]|nr:tetratricopeptide repeat protein [Rikenellaceae bacterium]
MRRILLTLLALIGVGLLTAEAQNLRQEALVKTRGRLQDDGSVTAGKPVADAEVQIKNGAKVFSDSIGELTFGVPASKSFYVQRVAKEGYTLSDYDIISSEQQYTSKVLDILLEDEEELRSYRRKIESKVRRNYQHQINLLTAKVDSLEASGSVSRQVLDSLYADIAKSWKLAEKAIEDMTERYLKIDFDREEAFDREISTYILNGQLDKADSMLRAKGDLTERAKRNKQVRRVSEKEMLDIAKDYDYRAQICRQRMQRDSAAYWLEQKAQLDPKNIDWQMEAGGYIDAYLSDYDRALSIYEPALEFARKHYGQIHEKTADLYNQIGVIYYLQSKYDAALDCHKRVLNISQRLFDEEHYLAAYAYHNIGQVYGAQNKYNECLWYSEKALSISKRVIGEKNITVTNHYSQIGSVYFYFGDYEKGLQYLNKSLDILKEILGEYRVNDKLAACYANIGYAHTMLGDYGNGLQYIQRALGISKILYGPDQPTTLFAVCYLGLGLSYTMQGDYEQGLLYTQKSLDIFKKIFGEEQPNQHIAGCYYIMLQIYDLMGIKYVDQEDYSNALNVF